MRLEGKRGQFNLIWVKNTRWYTLSIARTMKQESRPLVYKFTEVLCAHDGEHLVQNVLLFLTLWTSVVMLLKS